MINFYVGLVLLFYYLTSFYVIISGPPNQF